MFSIWRLKTKSHLAYTHAPTSEFVGDRRRALCGAMVAKEAVTSVEEVEEGEDGQLPFVSCPSCVSTVSTRAEAIAAHRPRR